MGHSRFPGAGRAVLKLTGVFRVLCAFAVIPPTPSREGGTGGLFTAETQRTQRITPFMDPEVFLKLLAAQGALLKGHFKLSSGLHSDTYLQCARLQESPDGTAFFMEELARRWKRRDPPPPPVEAVVGLAMGSIVFAYELARFLHCQTLFAERLGQNFAFRRGFAIQPERSYLVMEDVMTTGGSIQEVSSLIEDKGGKVAGWACLVDRTGSQKTPYPLFSLVRVSAPLYPEDDCSLCQHQVPLDTPGSKYTRDH